MPCKLCGNPASNNVCETCVKKIAGETTTEIPVVEESEQKQTDIVDSKVEDDLEVPTPKQGRRIDKDRAKYLWTKDEQSPEIAAIKKNLVDATERVSFEEFQSALEKAAEKFNEKNKDNTKPYAVLFDYKPHSSRRWVYELLKNKIEKPPQIARHFGPNGEKMNEYKLLEKNFQDGLKRFVIFDDAVYSGEQILNRTIKPIADYYKQMGHDAPAFDLVVPFVTNRALELFKKVGDNYNIKINIVYEKIMPTMRELISDKEMAVIQERGGMLDEEADEMSYLGATVTYFDHRVADDHSFSKEIRQAAGGLTAPKPYADETTDYYKNEEKEFQRYKESIDL